MDFRVVVDLSDRAYALLDRLIGSPPGIISGPQGFGKSAWFREMTCEASQPEPTPQPQPEVLPILTPEPEPAPQSTPQQMPAPVAEPTPAQPQTPPPVAQQQPPLPTATPGYTMEQLGAAGAQLVGMGKQPQVLEVMARYQIKSIAELDPVKYGMFAFALRELGASL